MGWCAAFGCQNNSRNNKDKSFFLMPENKTTKNAWIKAVNRTAKKSLKSIYSQHPLTRRPIILTFSNSNGFFIPFLLFPFKIHLII